MGQLGCPLEEMGSNVVGSEIFDFLFPSNIKLTLLFYVQLIPKTQTTIYKLLQVHSKMWKAWRQVGGMDG